MVMWTAATISRLTVLLLALKSPETVTAYVESSIPPNFSVLDSTSHSSTIRFEGGFGEQRTEEMLSWWFEVSASNLFSSESPLHLNGVVNRLARGGDETWLRVLVESLNQQEAAVMLVFPTSNPTPVRTGGPVSARNLLRGYTTVVQYTLEVTCRTVGRPPPTHISWYLNDTHRVYGSQQVSPDGYEVVSTVDLKNYNIRDNEIIRCRAINLYNANESSTAQEPSIKLSLYYVSPILLDTEVFPRPRNIHEGDYVHLRCHVMGNVSAYNVTWNFQGNHLLQNESDGVFINNDVLSLKSVDRRHLGDYTCAASTLERDLESLPLPLDIMLEPVCRSPERVYVVARQEEVQLECDAVGSPLGFRWLFNSTIETGGWILSHHEWETGGSQRVHRPVNDTDYGSYYCWAYNAVGLQDEPCVFHVVPPGKPGPPTNCSITNVTSYSLAVQCSSETDGGRRQSYLLEVLDIAEHHVVFNKTQQSPTFLVDALRPGRPFQINVAAVSLRCRSEWVRMNTTTAMAENL